MSRVTILDQMFSDADTSAERVALLEDFKAKMSAEMEATAKGIVRFDMATKTISRAPEHVAQAAEIASRFETITGPPAGAGAVSCRP